MENKEQILKDLKDIEQLYYDAYMLQNKASVLLSKYYNVNDYYNLKNNDFYKIRSIDTSSNIYEAELATRELINNLKNK